MQTRDDTNFVIADISRLLRAEFERLVENQGPGLTPGEAGLLVQLKRCGPIRQHLLAERLGLSKMTVTNYLDGLEAAGLVSRAEDPSDRRAKIVALTQLAMPVMDEISILGKAIWRTARGDIADRDWNRFMAVAQEIRNNLVTAKYCVAPKKAPASE